MLDHVIYATLCTLTHTPSGWSNFLTVIASTLMLLLVRNLYNHQDYEPLLKKRAYSAPKVEHADVIQNGALAIKIEENGD